MSFFHSLHTIAVQVMTGTDGETCPFRLWGAVGFISIIVFMGVAVYRQCAYDPMVYASGLAAYLTGWGASIFAKTRGEKE